MALMKKIATCFGGATGDNDELGGQGNEECMRKKYELELKRRRQEAELDRRERELLRSELEFTQRENEFLRGSGRRNSEHDSMRRQQDDTRFDRQRTITPSQNTISRMSIKALADLIGVFDGTPDMLSVWKRQLIFIKTAHDLSDDEAKILIGMKLKKSAFEWLHSRAEHLEMTFDSLVTEIERMYKPQSSVIEQRKKFEGRLWRKGESFRDYAHNKIVIGNRIPIPSKDLLEYLIEGIPDRVLCNQARMQQFSSTESLIEAFDRIKLGESLISTEVRSINSVRGGKSSAAAKGKHEDSKGGPKRVCYNCGHPDHISANCPVKTQGPKCFGCNEYGHIASKCPRKLEVPKQSNIVTCTARKQYTKNVANGERVIDALIDTVSDLTFMCYDEYLKLGSPTLRRCKLRFAGLGSYSHTAIGEFDTKIQIDGRLFPIRICVISDSLSSHCLLIGTDFLEKRNFHAKKGLICIDADEDDEVAEIMQINLCEEDSKEEVRLSHIENDDMKAEVRKLVTEYQPRKTIETTVSMRLVLKDNEPVYQKARRLSPIERDIVNKQVAEWESQGIVRPSSSDYASPVVLTKKKNGSHRLWVDYRLLNRKIVRDRFPLPLIEDQLDRLQGTKMFSTLDLRNVFFHVRVEDAIVKYTSFVVPDGQFEFLRVPFGLCNSPPVFQRYINAVFRDAIREGIVLTYMDDLIVIYADYVDGLERLKRVLGIASKAGLDINLEKCQFLTRRVEFLGHIIEDGMVKPSETKIEAVKHFPKPTTVRQVQAFLGLTGYFRKFIPDYSRIARPLSNLLRTIVTFKFDDAGVHTMDELKTYLTSRPVLSLYRTGARTELHTDASKDGY
ncbi:uncharacterized protein K02A2.6-like [Rhagoletis pomonella]|uniref:uncharacterized protein K02A2.6-like n=1 Tax=Rhagoletis pomonella TaxID=28610 RepID=UPI0017819182|nr:uncharacterized protein K02A2.6-like [Rhagoletis pomonella]XP_036345528.1 uncharacterized protein K02A2.6-like [Rhagoletis pomonella]